MKKEYKVKERNAVAFFVRSGRTPRVFEAPRLVARAERARVFLLDSSIPFIPITGKKSKTNNQKIKKGPLTHVYIIYIPLKKKYIPIIPIYIPIIPPSPPPMVK